MAAKAPGKKRSLYDILGVPRDAMAIDIGMAYKRKLAEIDRRADVDPNEAALVREAYHILCQPKEREAYDASLITREEREEAKTRPAPDFMLDAGDDDPAVARKKTVLWIGAAALAVLVILLAFAFTRSPPSERAKAASDRADAEDAKPAPPPPPPAPKKRTAAEVLALALPTVASIVAYDISGKPQPVGSGVVIAPDGIVTTCHALPPSATIVAKIGNDQIPANLVIYDEDLNLCRLSVGRLATTPLAAGPDEAKAGDAVYAVAQHKAGEISVVEGTVRNVRTTPGRLLELSMPVSASASGGALFDTYGRLVGVLTSKSAGTNAAVPASAVAQMRTRGQPAPTQ
jgi:hypothetical protein